MSERRLFLDESPGETRGVVVLDGQPERLLIQRHDDDHRLDLDARLVGRVASVEPAIGAAFLDVGGGLQVILPFKPDARPVRGANLEVQVRGEARDGKLATVRLIGEGAGAPRLVTPPPPLQERLQSFATGAAITEGLVARAMADAAEDEALEIVHPLPGGGSLAIEPTRALTAIDVDLGERKGADAKRAARFANLAAMSEAARLLRLKGLGGLVVLDLVGRGHDGNALMSAARLAFAPDNPGVAIGPVGRFGTMELSIPRRTRPILERLSESNGRQTDRALAQRAIRRLESEAVSAPGARLVVKCAPTIAAVLAPLVTILIERMGARFLVQSDPDRPRDRYDVSIG